MLSFCRDFDDESCPVSDRVLAKLFGANEGSLPGLLDSIGPEVKPALAFFCYRRAHLQSVGLAIAACCDESELVSFGGRAGTALFARSREERDLAPETTFAYRVSSRLKAASGPIQTPLFEEQVE
jgi:hypothetical protein